MKKLLLVTALASIAVAPLSLLASSAQAQTGCVGQNCALPGGHPADDQYKPANGDHGNNNANGG